MDNDNMEDLWRLDPVKVGDLLSDLLDRTMDAAFEGLEAAIKDLRAKRDARKRKAGSAGVFDVAYSVLGVSPTASKETVDKAYKEKAKQAHPDVGGSDAAMKALNMAYEVIKHIRGWT